MASVNAYLQVDHLTKRIGDRTLFEDISFGIAEGQRVGLIAKNGTGKTTLLNILSGGEGMDEGTVTYRRDLKVAYLPQSPHYDPSLTVLEACLSHGHESVKAKQILSRLSITDFDQPMGQLSGGQLKRVALADVLITEPELLILDEPTNHLDLQMIEWLENHLQRSNMALLMVTHDRYFLDRICSTILELDDQTLYAYRGNYEYYLEKRQARIDVTNSETARAQNLYRTELDWMRRMPCARGHKARYREESFYELEKVAKRRLQDTNIKLEVNASYIGNKIFEAAYISKAFGDKVILKDFYYNFTRYEKMGIVGNNGTGKSTFIKLLLGLQRPDSGHIQIGETVRFGYYSQEGMHFDDQMKVIDVVRDIAEYIDLGGGRHLSAMQFLQHFQFEPAQQQSYVYKLSGGERRRLYLCTVLMQNPNFLVLDEPTNDLDIRTLQILEEYLRDFKGCVIVVSHDRYFMDKLVDHILVFRGDGVVKDFPGNYSQFREYEDAREREAKAAPQKGRTGNRPVSSNATKSASLSASPSDTSAETPQKRKLTYGERLEMQALVGEIEQLEQQKADLEASLCTGTLSVDELTQNSKQLAALADLIDQKSMRWLELSEYE